MSDLSDLSDLSDKMGAPRYTRGFAGALCGLARAKMCHRGMLACLMATVVCVLRGRGACMGILGIFWEFLGGLLVRHVIPRGFAVPLCGLARAQMCRWGMPGNVMATAVCVSRGCGACV